MLVLFLKAKIPGGAMGDLLAQPVTVAGYANQHGTFVAPHSAIRHKHREEAPKAAPRQAALFLAPHPTKPLAEDRPRDPAPKPPHPEIDGAQRARQAAKLREMADAAMAAAEADINRDRNANTARRARMAGNAIAEAQHRARIASTMRNLADAIESGEAIHLGGITSRAAVEQLDSLAVEAKYQRWRQVGGAQWDRVREIPVTVEDIPFATMPRPHIGDWEARIILEAAKGKVSVPTDLRSALEGIAASGNARRLTPAETELLKPMVVKLAPKDDRYGAINNGVEAFKKLARLERIGITTDAQLWAALTEYLMFRGGARKEDPVKAAERALAGRTDIGVDFFPTPKPLGEQMMQLADIQPGMSVLEPSAGKGDLADMARAAGGKVDVVELSTTLHPILAAKGHNLVGTDFDTFQAPPGGYDRIIMNPPFSNRLDAAHVMRAFDMLAPGGRLVAITGEGVHFGADAKARAFRDWLDEHGAMVEKLPEGSFKSAFRPTGVATRMVVLDHPAAAIAAAAPAPDKPREGDTKTENGVEYRLDGGRWHRVTPEAEEGPASTSPETNPEPWQTNDFPEAVARLALDQPAGFTAADIAARWTGHTEDEALDLLHAHAQDFAILPDGRTWMRMADYLDGADPVDTLRQVQHALATDPPPYVAGRLKEQARRLTEAALARPTMRNSVDQSGVNRINPSRSAEGRQMSDATELKPAGSVLIRRAGPYTVTTDGDRFYVNGEQAIPMAQEAGATMKFLLNTGKIGANGKRDLVSLTDDQYAVHTATRAKRLAAMPPSLAQQRGRLVDAVEDATARAHDEHHSAITEGVATGRLRATPDRSAEITAARRALEEFDAQYPEIRAEMDEERERALQRLEAIRGLD